LPTTIINFFGAPSSGKSTAAAQLFCDFKKKNVSCELVTEYVKDWAWEQRPITKYDQLFIVMNQLRRETILFDKVDFIITDSPVLLGCFYDEYYNNHQLARHSVLAYLNMIQKQGIISTNYWLEHQGYQDTSGRYHKLSDCYEINSSMKKWLQDLNIKMEMQ